MRYYACALVGWTRCLGGRGVVCMCSSGGWLARHGGALRRYAAAPGSQWGLAYQQPTRARVSRVYVLEVGQSLYGFQSHQLPSVRDRVRIRFVVPS